MSNNLLILLYHKSEKGEIPACTTVKAPKTFGLLCNIIKISWANQHLDWHHSNNPKPFLV